MLEGEQEDQDELVRKVASKIPGKAPFNFEEDVILDSRDAIKKILGYKDTGIAKSLGILASSNSKFSELKNAKVAMM